MGGTYSYTGRSVSTDKDKSYPSKPTGGQIVNNCPVFNNDFTKVDRSTHRLDITSFNRDEIKQSIKEFNLNPNVDRQIMHVLDSDYFYGYSPEVRQNVHFIDAMCKSIVHIHNSNGGGNPYRDAPLSIKVKYDIDFN